MRSDLRRRRNCGGYLEIISSIMSSSISSSEKYLVMWSSITSSENYVVNYVVKYHFIWKLLLQLSRYVSRHVGISSSGHDPSGPRYLPTKFSIMFWRSLVRSYWIFFKVIVISYHKNSYIFLIIILKFHALIPCRLEANIENVPILLIAVVATIKIKLWSSVVLVASAVYF